MIGQPAEVLDWSGEDGPRARFGERWQARARQPLARGDHVEVAGIEGLTLIVRRAPAAVATHGAKP